VHRAAADLRYTPNAQAQAMARGRTNVVGLVLSDISDPYFASIAAGLMRAADQHSLLVTLASTGRRPDREVDHVAALRGQRAAAVVLAGSRVAGSEAHERLLAELSAFQATGGRVALIGQDRLGVPTVVPENRAGARALAEQLVGLGHTRFAVLAGPRDLLTSRDRLAGFREGLARSGIRMSPQDVVSGDFTRDGGHALMTGLLDAGTSATCVFAVNDVMAVGAMAALRERGVRLPSGMAVAGFDDIAPLRDVTPSLTTVRLPLELLGERALELALGPPRGREVRRVRGEVVLRESTPRLQ
jgi:LacI family transcriptional regulator